MEYMYSLNREGVDNPEDVIYFVDRNAALDHLIRVVVNTGFTSLASIFVYSKADDGTHTLKISEIILLKPEAEHCYDKQTVLVNPSLLYEHLLLKPCSITPYL